MLRLLRANFTRLRKSRLFWLAMAFMVSISVFALANQYGLALEYNFVLSLDNFIFGYCIIIGVLLAVFFSLFLGTEYSDGVIRNKLIVGHGRVSLYFATLITSIEAAFLVSFAYLAAVFAVGIPLFGPPSATLPQIAVTMLGSIFMIIAVCAILTALNMLITSKAVVAIVSILGMILLLMMAINIENKLAEPEYYPAYALMVDGELTVSEDDTPNPNYLSGTKRAIYERIYDILPAGQALQFVRMEAAHPLQMALYSLAIAIISTFLGLVFFRRKDLK